MFAYFCVILHESGDDLGPQARSSNYLDIKAAARVEVKFQFLGQKDPNRMISLQVALLDGNGKVLGRTAALCSDSRLAVSDNPTISVSTENSESLKIKLSPVELDRIHQVAVEFQEASNSETQ